MSKELLLSTTLSKTNRQDQGKGASQLWVWDVTKAAGHAQKREGVSLLSLPPSLALPPTIFPCLYQFPVAAMTTYHKLRGLNNTNILSYRSEVGNGSHWTNITMLARLHPSQRL